ncbi:MAG: 2Fe-2S iron-sulfur cluster-binding protein [Pseudomonadota bacterium]
MSADRKQQNFKAKLQQQDWHFSVNAEASVLEAALIAGIVLPNSCRNGTCRTCICSLVSGQVAYKIEWPGLSKEEKDQCMILPCVATALTDLVLHVPHAVKTAVEN